MGPSLKALAILIQVILFLCVVSTTISADNRIDRTITPATTSATPVASVPAISPSDPGEVKSISQSNMISATKTTESKTGDNSRLWNLKDVDIRTFIRAMADETGKNFAVDPRVTGKITFVASRPLSKDALYQAFLSALQVNGFVILPSGAVQKIVPDFVAKGLSSPLFADVRNKTSDSMSVSVVGVRYVPAVELASALTQFLSPSGRVVAYAPSNDLIVADHAGNIYKLMRLVQQLDQPQARKIEIIQLHNAQAKNILTTLTSLLAGKGQTGGGGGSAVDPNLAVDERTNSILMSSGGVEQRAQIRTAIRILDRVNTGLGNVTEVIYLHHLNAERTATIVAGLIQGYYEKMKEQGGKGEQASRSILSGLSTNVASGTSSNEAAASLFNTGYSGATTGGSTGANTQTESGLPTTSLGLPPSGSDIPSIVGRTPRSGSLGPAIQWEESTNSLVITVPRELMNRIRQVLTKLDVRRPQVLIEAVIAEVSLDRQRELGVELNLDLGLHVGLISRFPPGISGLSGITPDGTLVNPDKTSAIGRGGTVRLKRGDHIRALVRMLESDRQSNVLATPNLLTLDNEPAQIKVGGTISVTTSRIENSAGGGNPVITFGREQTGLVLTINPQITPNGAVKLLIQQALTSVVPGSAATNAVGNPDTTERFLRTTVMADDGQILVLGGLLQNQWGEGQNKLPFLGDIPGIGNLFKSKNRSLAKTNLMIFLKPTIIYNERDGVEVSGGKYEYLRQSQLQTERDSPARYSYESPVMPRSGQEVNLPPPFPARAVRYTN